MNLFRAGACSEEVGYEHTWIRCWWDNRVIVHYGPLYWLCSGCREMAKEGCPPLQMNWRALFEHYWEGTRDRLRGMVRK